MVMDNEAKALVQQLVDALMPLTGSIMAPKHDDPPDSHLQPMRPSRAALKKADAAKAAALVALASATSS